MTANEQLYADVEKIYAWIDARIAQHDPRCAACGKCCDFVCYDHRLYVATPELLFFRHTVAPQEIKPMAGGLCPWNRDGKCNARRARFAGCRIFHCDMDNDAQSALAEQVLGQMKAICKKYDLPYRYVELSEGFRLLMSGDLPA